MSQLPSYQSIPKTDTPPAHVASPVQLEKFPQLVPAALEDTLGVIKHASFVLPPDHAVDHSGTATIPSEVANMTKNLIGGGVLSLSGGIALFANDPKGSISAIVDVVILGAVFGYFCLLIGKSCQLTRSSTYRECWENTVGKRGGLFVAIVNTIDPLLGIFANASILSQSLQLLLQGVSIYLPLQVCLLLVTILALLPLCLQKNLDALAPYSAMGMAAVLAALAAMVVRLLDESYLPGGTYYDDSSPKLRPKFGTSSHPWSTRALPFVCMVYTSFDMHYNSPRFYAELRNASIPRFAQTVAYSFGAVAVVYFSIAVVGFLTFGAHCDSYILNNYSPKDPLATFSRLAIGVSCLVSYPLNFIGVRDNCLDILGITNEINDSPRKLRVFTALLLSLLTLSSCFVTDLGLINSVGGGTTVTLLAFLFPALMFREALKKKRHQTWQETAELWFVMILMILGIVVGVVGVWVSLNLDILE